MLTKIRESLRLESSLRIKVKLRLS
jgi:hypothetical protein